MADGLLKNTNSFTKLIFTALIIIGSFLLFLFVASLLAFPIFDLDTDELLNVLDDIGGAENLGIMKYFQIWLSVGTFIFPAFVIAYFISGNAVGYLKVNQSLNIISILNVILVMLIALPIINILAKWNSEMELPGFLDGLEARMRDMEDRAGQLTDTFLKSNSATQYVVNLFMIAIIPALGEEFLFRGVIQRIFCEWTKNKHIGVIIAAVIFSAFHLQFYGFMPRLAMGIFFGYLFIWSGSIWLPVLAHFVNNGLAVTVYFIYGKEFVEKDVDSLGTGNGGFLLIVITTIFVALLIGYIYRTEKFSDQST